MPITFYPAEGELQSNALPQKIEILMEAAERYKAIMLEIAAKQADHPLSKENPMVPRKIAHSYNWEEITAVLREIRDLTENTPANKAVKAGHLAKLAEIYEVLRAAKMPKLEAVRLALVNEANQLRRS